MAPFRWVLHLSPGSSLCGKLIQSLATLRQHLSYPITLTSHCRTCICCPTDCFRLKLAQSNESSAWVTKKQWSAWRWLSKEHRLYVKQQQGDDSNFLQMSSKKFESLKCLLQFLFLPFCHHETQCFLYVAILNTQLTTNWKLMRV